MPGKGMTLVLWERGVFSRYWRKTQGRKGVTEAWGHGTSLWGAVNSDSELTSRSD